MYKNQIGMNLRSIKLVEYNPFWADIFDFNKKRIGKILHNFDFNIHHVGSTAIPTIEKTKPIIDILIGIGNVNDIQSASEIIAERGLYEKGDAFIAKQSSQGNRMMVNKVNNPNIVFNFIHLFIPDSLQYNDMLLFKRYLLEHPQEALKYFRLKSKLSECCPHDITSYTEGKINFVKRINKQAKELYH